MLSRRLQCLDLYTYSVPTTKLQKGSNTTAITVLKYYENIQKTYQYNNQHTNTENSTKLILNIHLHAWIYALWQLLVHYKENTTTNTIGMLKRDRKTPRSIQIRLKVQCNCCKLTSPILRVASSMPAAVSTIFGQSTCLSILIHRFEV